MLPSFPSEVIDHVIDDLHDNAAALRACGLVSRNWVPASRYHLCDSVHVTAANLSSFLALLECPHNTLTMRVKSLHATSLEHCDLVALWRILPIFPYLRELHFHQLSLLYDKDFELPGPQQLLPRITALSISTARFASCADMESLLLRFPSVKSLIIERTVCYGQEKEFRKASSHTELKLDRLRITLILNTLQWLKWRHFHLGATDIDMDMDSMNPDPRLAGYFKVVGERLQRLTVRFQSPKHPSIFADQDLLKYTPSLRSFCLTGALCLSADHGIRASPGLDALLRQLAAAAPLLEELSLAVSPAPAPHTLSRWADPGAAVRTLECEAFGRMRVLRLDFDCNRGPPPQVRAQIAARLLPRLYARGMVSVGS